MVLESAEKIELRRSNNALVAQLSQMEGEGAKGLAAGGRASYV